MREKLLKICAFFLVLLLFMGYFFRDDLRGTFLTDIDSLATTNGTIVYSSVSISEDRDPFFGVLPLGPTYEYSINYEFKVDNKTFQSDKINFGFRRGNLHFAESYVEKYPVRRVVTVFYDRNDPSFSALEPDVKNERLIYYVLLIVVFAIVCVVGLALEIAEAITYDHQRYSRSLR